MAKTRLNRTDQWRLIALLLWALPMAALLPLGLWWLWRIDALLYWLAALFLCSASGYGLQGWLRRKDQSLLADAETGPDPDWPPRAQVAWQAVEALAGDIKAEDWPLADGPRLWLLGRETLERVARTFHPRLAQPLLALTLPHGLLIIERACRELRTDIVGAIPLSHHLTLGDLVRINRWKNTAERLYSLYRAGRVVFNPGSALLSEAWGELRRRSYGAAWDDLRRWLLREYVHKVGKFAIELYSGRLILGDEPSPTLTPASRLDAERAELAAGERAEEPLRILVLGRSNAGKSSLVNALFGQVTAPIDCLPDATAPIAPYRFERDGLATALVFDTPGIDTPGLSPKALDQLANKADMILWVTVAHRPDREREGDILNRLRGGWRARPDHHPPALLVAVSHIDQLRPPREWQPPYDLRDPSGVKAANIRAAVEAVAGDFEVPIADVIPVCLGEGRIYNVADSLWAAILDHQNDANRVRLLRYRDAHKKIEDWVLFRRQLVSAGRFLTKLPGRLLG